MSKRAVFYARVSTADQVDGTSLQTQQEWCVKEIQKQGMALADSYVDAGVSGADQSVSELAFHAQNRLPQMSDKDKREVCNLLDIRVFISDITNSEPQIISIHGQLDERLVDGGEQQSDSIRGLRLRFELDGPQSHDGRHE
jgi:DNA invertase Pin-like site-specific DNA recombinase